MNASDHSPFPAELPERPRVALIAHDGRKESMELLCKQWGPLLSRCEICATENTARRVSSTSGLDILHLLPGSMGGDLQIGAKVAQGDLELVIFLRDPLAAQSHEPDVAALMRVCDAHDVALATNLSSANMAMLALDIAFGAASSSDANPDSAQA